MIDSTILRHSSPTQCMRLLAPFDHPNIIKCYEVFCEDSHVYIVLERMQMNLYQFMRSEMAKPLQESDVCVIMYVMLSPPRGMGPSVSRTKTEFEVAWSFGEL